MKTVESTRLDRRMPLIKNRQVNIRQLESVEASNGFQTFSEHLFPNTQHV